MKAKIALSMLCAGALFCVAGFINARTANAAAQTQKRIAVRCGRLIDGKSDKPIENAVIVVEGERITTIGGDSLITPGTETIDLSRATVLPGLIENHTHVLLQGDITAEDYDEQLPKESVPYRTTRAVVAAKISLMNGFTAIRDLETEGAMYADADLKKAINNGVVPGPRMFVSTRALSATGMYP